MSKEESKELTEVLESIDDMVDKIGKLIISIANNNDYFVCTECLYIAKTLYEIMRKYAREEDADRIYEEFKEITGRYIDD
jgi:rubrerythrin